MSRLEIELSEVTANGKPIADRVKYRPKILRFLNPGDVFRFEYVASALYMRTAKLPLTIHIPRDTCEVLNLASGHLSFKPNTCNVVKQDNLITQALKELSE